MNGKYILVVSFGTSYAETRERTIEAIERQMAEEFPDYEVRRAFTSGMIIRKLRQRDGIEVDDLPTAFARLVEDGAEEVVVQPTHVMNGVEYDMVVDTVFQCYENFKRVGLGTPLLNSIDDYDRVVGIIRDEYLVDEPDTAVVLMGHGTYHHANSAYPQLQLKLQLAGMDDVYVTTVEGFPDFDDTVSMMRGKGYRNVVLYPLMLVAGDHAINDMAGDEEDSLASVLKSEGYGVRSVIRGMGESPEFRRMFIDHARLAMARSPEEDA